MRNYLVAEQIQMVVPFWPPFMFHTSGLTMAKCRHYIRVAMRWHRIVLRIVLVKSFQRISGSRRSMASVRS